MDNNKTCDNCKHSKLINQYEKSPMRADWLDCNIVNNDFCCGGSDKYTAGVIGGGAFRCKPNFGCNYFEPK